MKNHAVVLFVLVALFGAACSGSAVIEQDTSPVAADAESSTAIDQAESEPAVDAAVEDAAVEDAADEPEAAAAPEETAAPEQVEVVADEPQEPVAAVETSSAASLLGSSDWCTAAAQIETILDPDDLRDPVALEESYRTAVALIAEAARIAPDAISSDVAAMAQAVATFSSLLEEAEWNFLDVDLVAMEEVAVGMDVPGYNIEVYNYEVCGIGEDPSF